MKNLYLFLIFHNHEFAKFSKRNLLKALSILNLNYVILAPNRVKYLLNILKLINPYKVIFGRKKGQNLPISRKINIQLVNPRHLFKSELID